VDPAQVWDPLHCPSVEAETPEAEPVDAGADPVAADEAATEATGLTEATELGADPPVVEVTKPDGAAPAEVVTGMMVRTSEEELIAIGEEVATGEGEDAAGEGDVAAGEGEEAAGAGDDTAGDEAAGAGDEAAAAVLLVPPPTEPEALPDEPEDPPPIPFTAAQVPE
jgi:hypothetical protein